MIGHFGDESFQSITFTGTDNLTRTTKRQNTQITQNILKKRPEETQTLSAGCSKAEPKFFRPVADPLPGGAGRPKFNQLQTVTTFT